MRFLVAMVSCALVTACTSAPTAGRETSSTPTATPTASATAITSASGDKDPCSLLTEADVTTLIGLPARPQHADGGGLPVCRWRIGDKTYVQTTSVSALEWAQALPTLARDAEATGVVRNQQALDRLRTAVARVKAGEVLNPDEACSLFSEMLVLRGKPAGTTSQVFVFPTQGKALGVTAQACSDGRFSTILVADLQGVDEKALVPAVTALLPTVHQRAKVT